MAHKTGKREVACAFNVLVFAHKAYVTLAIAPEHVATYSNISDPFVWPGVLLLGAAYGMEWAQQAGLVQPKQP